MGLTINTNMSSLFTRRALDFNTRLLGRTAERLSTGLRINRAADDASGLTISEKLTARIRGFEQAKQNIGDGISLIQTAEGGLSIVQDNLQFVRELWVQGQSTTLSSTELDALQTEINARITTINDLALNTRFNGISLLDNGAAATENITIQSGSDNGETTSVVLATSAADVGINVLVNTAANGTMGEGSIALNTFRLAGTVNVKAQGGGAAFLGNLTQLDMIIDNVSRMRSSLGATQNSLESKLDYASVAVESYSGARSRIVDADIAEESANFSKYQILQSAAASMLKEANLTPELALQLLP